MMNLAKARKIAFNERVDEGAKIILRHREECESFSVLLNKTIENLDIDPKKKGRQLKELKKIIVALASKQDRERREFGL